MISEKKSCLIIDDDNFARETLEDLLDEIGSLKIIKSISKSETAIKDIAILKPDIVFLDINMPGKNGMSVLNEIQELNLTSKVIFVTAHQEYLLEALKKNVYDYLVKPISIQDLKETLNRFEQDNIDSTKVATTSNSLPKDERILIQNSYGTLYLSPKDVVCIEADGSYSKLLFGDNKQEIISKHLGKIESCFPTNVFFKISRSAIINVLYLHKIDRLKRLVYLNMEDGIYKLKASKERIYDLEHFINNHQYNQ